MTALGTGQIFEEWKTNAADRHALLRLTGFTTGDTADLVSWFSAVKLAVLVSATGSRIGVQTVAGTVVTLSTTGLAGDAGYLLVWGSIAPTA